MELAEKKEIMGEYAKKLEKQIAREKFVLREIEDDKATLKFIEQKKQSGESLEDSAYVSYDEWIESINKEIKVGENTLKNIEFKKIELEAIKAYIA